LRGLSTDTYSDDPETLMKESPRPATARNPLAYKNEEFMASDDARPLRILAEYLEPMQRFAREGISGTIVFFGSARLDPNGPLGRYYEDARTLARLLTSWSASLPEGRDAWWCAQVAAAESWRPPTAAPPRLVGGT